jgi:carboxylesterase type B
MPWAAPPTGDRRFRTPASAPAWDGRRLAKDYVATDYGASCLRMYDRGVVTDLSLSIATLYTALSDMPLMFSNADRSAVFTGESDAAFALEAQLAETWLAFARTGSPQNVTIPEWPASEPEARPTLVFDVVPEVVADPKGEALRVRREVLAGQE